MTIRQKILRAFYPLMIVINRWLGSRAAIKINKNDAAPPVSFYHLVVKANDGSNIRFDNFKGKKVLIVNTASNCIYTSQYDGLQKLHEQFRDRLVLIAFPANDFSSQEPGTDGQIAAFCAGSFGIRFLLAAKSTVTKEYDQNAVFKWLTHKNDNGWNDLAPAWNFGKFLVNENGVLTHYFGPGIEPGDGRVLQAIGGG